MPKLSINILGWNHREELAGCMGSVITQTWRDFELFFMDNASADGSSEYVREKFPDVTVVVNNKNLGYAGGHNLFFGSAATEFVMVINPDARLAPDFLERAMRAFGDPSVGAVTGKILRPAGADGKKIIDTTGITVDRTRRGRDRGQHEEDIGQYDAATDIFGVSGAAPIFRRSALNDIRIPAAEGQYEYYDQDFFAYWEDMDLSWRLRLSGYRCVFAPDAVAYHPRKAGSSPGGYKHLAAFVRHHRNLPQNIRKWNWRNHLFCIIKNDFGWPLARDFPSIFVRELAMFGYILIFEPGTLAAIPEFFRLLPKMLVKRKYILKNKKATAAEAEKWFL